MLTAQMVGAALWLSAVLLAVLLAGCAASNTQTTPSGEAVVDVLITGGRIIDGAGNSWVRGDIAVKDGKIVAVGKFAPLKAKRTIDARDQIVSPGFIDVHAHVEFGLFETPATDNFLQDGVTTVVTGNCGGSADSLREFFARIDQEKISMNVASLVGHNTIRREVMGLANRLASPDEQRKMEALVDREMRAGAVGLSTGLLYLPGIYSDTAEVVGLAKAAAKHNGVYASHIRNEGGKVVEAINEALDVGRQAKMPVQVSHFKVSAPANWGRSPETLLLIETARRNGEDVTIDQYPYTASSTSLSVVLPDWAREGGDEDVAQRLRDPAQKAKIAAEILQNAITNKRGNHEYAVVARHGADPSLNGKSIARINRERGRPTTLEAEIDTLLEVVLAGGAQMVFHGISEDDVRYFMRYPFNMIAADGGVQNGKGQPHPRSYGTNARVLARYVRDEKLITLEDAVRRMTSLPAQKFQLKGRGLLREGYAADILIFDETRVTDKATFERPHQFSQGFSLVMVNGEVVVESGKHTGARSGRALRSAAAAN